MKFTKHEKRKIRHQRVKSRIKGTKEVPRVSAFRSNKNIFVQFIDDINRKTIISSNVKPKAKNQKGTKTEIANLLGQSVAQKAKEVGISKVVFDRGGFKYHGRIKALSEGLRKGGLKF